MAFTKSDLKSPRDLALHLQDKFSEPFEKVDVETDTIDKARNFNGSSPAAAAGAWAETADLIDTIGTAKTY